LKPQVRNSRIAGNFGVFPRCITGENPLADKAPACSVNKHDEHFADLVMHHLRSPATTECAATFPLEGKIIGSVTNGYVGSFDTIVRDEHEQIVGRTSERYGQEPESVATLRFVCADHLVTIVQAGSRREGGSGEGYVEACEYAPAQKEGVVSALDVAIVSDWQDEIQQKHVRRK
jgi:hypothetical protein